MKQSELLKPYIDKCYDLCNERFGYQMAIKILCDKFGLNEKEISELARNRKIDEIKHILNANPTF